VVLSGARPENAAMSAEAVCARWIAVQAAFASLDVSLCHQPPDSYISTQLDLPHPEVKNNVPTMQAHAPLHLLDAHLADSACLVALEAGASLRSWRCYWVFLLVVPPEPIAAEGQHSAFGRVCGHVVKLRCLGETIAPANPMTSAANNVAPSTSAWRCGGDACTRRHEPEVAPKNRARLGGRSQRRAASLSMV
jgi:hypothetical protein